ncbi:MAG: VCBS repeat-containing protein [Desulfurivibrionaceae bacterium]
MRKILFITAAFTLLAGGAAHAAVDAATELDTTCLNCHGDNRDKVSLSNNQWTKHNGGRVTADVYAAVNLFLLAPPPPPPPPPPTSEILWRNQVTGANMIWHMEGENYVSSSPIDSVSDLNWKIVGRADFNGDGHSDILWRNTATGVNRVWYMNLNTKLGFEVIGGATDPAWTVVGTGDFNDDGEPDILWRNTSTGTNIVWYMSYVAGLTKIGHATIGGVADQNWTIVGTGDFNNDGKLDILWRNTANGMIVTWYMNGVTYLGSGRVGVVADQDWKIAGVRDVDGDASPDILWRNRVTGANLVWRMSGVTRSGNAALRSAPPQWTIGN